MAPDIAALLACCITVAIFIPYLRWIRRGALRPRCVSWVVWSLSTLLVGGGQLLAGAGVGATPILLSGALSGVVAVLAALQARATPGAVIASNGDRWCLGISLMCVPLWAATGDPLWSVLVLTAIDLVGFIPTCRAIWRDPHQESAVLFTAFAVRNAVATLALEERNLTTVIFPGAIGAACGLVALGIIVGRHRLRRLPPGSYAP